MTKIELYIQSLSIFENQHNTNNRRYCNFITFDFSYNYLVTSVPERPEINEKLKPQVAQPKQPQQPIPAGFISGFVILITSP